MGILSFMRVDKPYNHGEIDPVQKYGDRMTSSMIKHGILKDGEVIPIGSRLNAEVDAFISSYNRQEKALHGHDDGGRYSAKYDQDAQMYRNNIRMAGLDSDEERSTQLTNQAIYIRSKADPTMFGSALGEMAAIDDAANAAKRQKNTGAWGGRVGPLAAAEVRKESGLRTGSSSAVETGTGLSMGEHTVDDSSYGGYNIELQPSRPGGRGGRMSFVKTDTELADSYNAKTTLIPLEKANVTLNDIFAGVAFHEGGHQVTTQEKTPGYLRISDILGRRGLEAAGDLYTKNMIKQILSYTDEEGKSIYNTRNIADELLARSWGGEPTQVSYPFNNEIPALYSLAGSGDEGMPNMQRANTSILNMMRLGGKSPDPMDAWSGMPWFSNEPRMSEDKVTSADIWDVLQESALSWERSTGGKLSPYEDRYDSLSGVGLDFSAPSNTNEHTKMLRSIGDR